MKHRRKSKCLLAGTLAFTLAFTPLLNHSITVNASSPKAVKSVTVKIGKKKVNKKTYTLKKDKSITLKVSIAPKSAKKKITFKSSKKNIVAVNKKGKVTAKKPGTSKITITVTGKNNKKKSTWVKIKVPKSANTAPTTQTPTTQKQTTVPTTTEQKTTQGQTTTPVTTEQKTTQQQTTLPITTEQKTTQQQTTFPVTTEERTTQNQTISSTTTEEKTTQQQTTQVATTESSTSIQTTTQTLTTESLTTEQTTTEQLPDSVEKPATQLTFVNKYLPVATDLYGNTMENGKMVTLYFNVSDQYGNPLDNVSASDYTFQFFADSIPNLSDTTITKSTNSISFNVPATANAGDRITILVYDKNSGAFFTYDTIELQNITINQVQILGLEQDSPLYQSEQDTPVALKCKVYDNFGQTVNLTDGNFNQIQVTFQSSNPGICEFTGFTDNYDKIIATAKANQYTKTNEPVQLTAVNTAESGNSTFDLNIQPRTTSSTTAVADNLIVSFADRKDTYTAGEDIQLLICAVDSNNTLITTYNENLTETFTITQSGADNTTQNGLKFENGVASVTVKAAQAMDRASYSFSVTLPGKSLATYSTNEADAVCIIPGAVTSFSVDYTNDTIKVVARDCMQNRVTSYAESPTLIVWVNDIAIYRNYFTFKNGRTTISNCMVSSGDTITVKSPDGTISGSCVVE